jgi:hypothetical protein
MRKRDYTKGSIPYSFIAMPTAVIQSPEWQALPPNAVKLAIDLMGQYTGKNNGRLSPSFVAMKKCGWSSKTTLVAAKKVLLEYPCVVLTRVGHAPRTAEWIAFTWWPLHYDKSMDIDPRSFPYLNFFKLVTAAPVVPKKISEVQKMDRYPPKTATGGPENGPMEALP